MTYKHIDFSSSSTMRSLVKVAQEKGWIKEEPLQKTAAVTKTADLQPTTNLTENVLKLCNGLRERGFNKYAEELENNLFVYKQANTLYDVSKEKGEDLIQAAHPHGSHKMEDVDSMEAVFEDLIEKHTKTMKAVDKMPTGKLTEASAILGAVKLVLAAEASTDASYEQAKVSFQKFRQVYASIASKLGDDVSANSSYFDLIERALDQKKVYDTRDIEGFLVNALANLQRDSEPGWFASGNEQQTWQNEILPMINIANRYALQFQTIVGSIRIAENAARVSTVQKQYDPDALQEKPAAPPDPVLNKGTTLVQTLTAYLSLAAVNKNPAAQKWIKNQIGEIQDVIKRYVSAQATGQLDAVRSSLAFEMNEKQKEVDDFARKVNPGTP